MQIHELNNFTGTLGAGAYIAIDDGTDTGKISSQGLLAATEARIDNIIAGPAPSAEEIVDARLGADGVTYPSLGDAIRDQFTDVKSEINEIDKVFFNIASSKVYEMEISTSGSGTQLYTYSAECIKPDKSYFIMVSLDDVKLTSSGLKIYGCSGRNSSSIVDTIEQFRGVSTGSNVLTGIYQPSASNIKYFAVGLYQNDSSYTQKATAYLYEILSDSIYNIGDRVGALESYKNQLVENAITANLTFTNGTLNNTTGAVSSSTKSIVTDFFNGDGYFNFTIKNGYRYKFMIYNLDGSINDACDGWGSNNSVVGVHSIPVDRNHKYRLQLSTNASTSDFAPEDYGLAISDMQFVSDVDYKMGDVVAETRNFGYSTASFAIIKGKLYVFNYTSSSNPGTAVMGNIYYLSPFGIMQKSNKTFTCDAGHMNTVDYCEKSDCLIIGNGGSSSSTQPNKIYIWKNASAKTDFLISDSDCTVIDVSASDWGKQLNCVWGENNSGQNNIIYCLTNYESGNMSNYAVNNPNNFTGESKRFIKRVLLGKGTNQLSNGSYTAVSDSNFNGTYEVLNEWEREFISIEANNDTCFYDGKVVETIVATNSGGTIYGLPYIMHETINFGEALETKKKSIPIYNANGSAVGYENNGIVMKNEYGYIGKNGYIYTFKAEL